MAWEPQQHDGMARLEASVSGFDRRVREMYDVLRRLRPAARRPAGPAAAPSILTERELRILRLIADGADNDEIAAALHYAVGTIKLDVRRILRKLGTANRTVAAVRAVRAGLI